MMATAAMAQKEVVVAAMYEKGVLVAGAVDAMAEAEGISPDPSH